MSLRPPCLYQPRCPGCPRFAQPDLSETAVAQLHELVKQWGGPDLELHPFEGQGHRMRARLSVRGEVGHMQLGIFEAGSHSLVHIPRCPIHHPAIVELGERLIDLVNVGKVIPYNERQHQGELRAAQFAVQPDSGKVQLTLLLRQAELKRATLSSRLLHLASLLEAHTHSLFFASLPERNNSLLGKDWLHMSGPLLMKDTVGGASVYYPPDAFGQANPILHRQVVDQIHRFVGPDEGVTEYYAGVGSIGMGLTGTQRRVLFNEVGSGSLHGLRAGLEQRPDVNARILEGPAGQHANAYAPNDIVIVDPPRKGLDVELLRQLLSLPPQRLIYLSCGLGALLSEMEQLRLTGHYQMKHISAWAYFPFTEHVETLVVLERAEPNKKRPVVP